MSDLTAEQTCTATIAGARSAQAEKPYPRHLVVLSVLTFCLSFWAAVIFAAMRFG
jgi:hypothetical protein